MQIWVMAQVHSFTDEDWADSWDLGGVFSAEELARENCTAPDDCYWPATLDEYAGRATTTPPGLTFPNR